MAKNQSLDARRDLFVTAWNQLAAEESFGGMTLAQFTAATEAAMVAREDIANAKALLSSLVGQRVLADVELRKALKLVANGVRGNPQYGDNGTLYRAMGFVPTGERATGKTNVKSATPPANAA
jgi:hypothetical protein